MSFNCMNINSSFLKIIEPGNFGDIMTDLNDFSKGDILFKEQFASMLQGNQLKTGGLKSGNVFESKG